MTNTSAPDVLEPLAAIAATLGSARDGEALVAHLTEVVRSALGAEYGAYYAHRDGAYELRCELGGDVAAPPPDALFAAATARGTLGEVSFLAARVPAHGSIVGGVVVARGTGAPFDDTQEKVLAVLACYAGIALANTRLAEERDRLVGERDEFLSSVRHELRTPLAALSMGAQLLAAEFDRLTGDRRARIVGAIERQSRALEDVIDGLGATS